MQLRVMRVFTLCALGVLVLAGCDTPPSADDEKAGAPQPKADEIQRELTGVLQPLFAMTATASPDSPVPPDMSANLRKQLDEKRVKLASAPAYKEAVHTVVLRLEDETRLARDAQNAALVLVFCDVIRYFQPNNARLPRYEKWAETVKNRPIVTIRGWYEPRDTEERTIYVFVEVLTPADGQVHHAEVREGEEFFDLRFLRMIGNKRGIELEYLVTGDVFEIYSRSWLRQQ